MPLLEVLTRCYKRPVMLAHNQASLQQQTCKDFTQTLLHDDVGRGIGWSYANMAAFAPRLVGDYIWILDDDDYCIHNTLVAELQQIVQGSQPEVIFVKMHHGPLGVLPDKRAWGCEPKHAHIGCSAFIVRRDVWQAHASSFGEHYAGDFDFISRVYWQTTRHIWHDVIASKVQKISYGAAE